MSSSTGGKPKLGEDWVQVPGQEIHHPRGEGGCGGGTRSPDLLKGETLTRPGCSSYLSPAPPRAWPDHRAPPRPAPPGRGPARLAGRRDRCQIRPRGERVRGAGAGAVEASEPSLVQPLLPHLRLSPPEPARCRPNSDRLEGTWSRVMGPNPGTSGGGRGAGLPRKTRFCPLEPRAGGGYCLRPGPARRAGPGGAVE